jgi:hypothetical protein
MDKIRIGFALLPSIEHQQKLVALQKLVRCQYSLEPELSLDGNLPHLTLFQGSFTADTPYSAILKSLSEGLSYSEFRIPQAAEPIVYQPKGWYFLLVLNTVLLAGLHEEVLARCLPYLAIEPLKQSDYLADLTPAERASFEAFGYRYAGTCFLPHITLGRLYGDETADVVETINRELVNSFANDPICFDAMSVYMMGINGAHSETLAHIKL